jgi:DNA-binding NarL/FixJ family response regulator
MNNTVKVFLSNRGQPDDIARGRELGAAGYIVKATATPSEVVKKVMDILENTKK